MDTTKKGNAFEQKAFDKIKLLLEDGNFLCNPITSRIFQKKKYPSKDRKGSIEIDISIESTMLGAKLPSLYIMIECKDYQKAVNVGKLEEFHSKVQQITGNNVKAVFVTTSLLQAAALEFAISKKIAVIRILPDNNIEMLANYKGKHKFEAEKVLIHSVMNALINEKYKPINQYEFGLVEGQAFNSLKEMFKFLMESYEINDQYS